MRKKLSCMLLCALLLITMFAISITADATKATGTPLAITTQPKDVTVDDGVVASTTIKVTGDGLTYKWYYKNRGASTFKYTSSFSGDTYYTRMNSERDGRQIYCVITDQYGKAVQTNTVTLSMKSTGNPVTITKQPSSASVGEGMVAKATVKATGDGLTYKWYYKNKGASTFKYTSSFSGNTYTTRMNAERNGRQIYCVITDKDGKSVQSNTVTLSMKETGSAVKITTQPASVTVADDVVAKTTVVATGDDLTYKWYYKDKGASTFTYTSSFSGRTYSVRMNTARDGRQIYCEVADKYGNSVKSNVVTLSREKMIARISKQPVDVKVLTGDTATVTFTATGDSLTYKWYYKDTTQKTFRLTNTFKSNTYTAEMTDARDGRQVYCVVTDQYGNTARTDAVTISKATPLEILAQPQDVLVENKADFTISLTATGDGLSYKWYYKDAGSSIFRVTPTFVTNVYESSMTHSRNGRQVYCVVTDAYGRSVTSGVATITMKPAYYITVDKGVGDVEVIGVNTEGTYSLSTPTISGYTFKGWVDSNDKSFASSGKIKSNVAVKAVWELEGTNTLKELVDRTNAGVSEIVISGNITVTQPIFIAYDTKIYADTNCSITRSPSYAGDIFVVGEDKSGVPAVLNHREAALTLGGGKGTLTIDGNSSKLKVTVVGSAIYLSDSATVNLYDGVRIANNKKLGNERIFTDSYFAGSEVIKRAGGAALLNMVGTVNMYGGVIENNLVATEYTVVTDADGNKTSNEYNACGGAIYNRGNFNMYGGTINNSEALRGGGIYSDRVVYLEAGTISNNTAHSYGGGFSSSSSYNTDTFVGTEGSGATMLFSGNHCNGAGGAMYSNTSSPIIICGNAKFTNNTSNTSGGAIYTAGPLTVRNSQFNGNSSVGSGGAIYHHYTKAEFQRREFTMNNCSFENNKSNLGGAVILSATGTAASAGEGTVATITDCTFKNNQAVMKDTSAGNGGAIYITKQSDATIKGCTFTENTSVNNAGAIAVQSESTLKLSESTFTKNSALNGGALYVTPKTVVSLSDLTFTGNSAVTNASGGAGLGGAAYLDAAKVTAKNVDMKDNTAAAHGGGVYMKAITLNVDTESEFTGNSATKHGGAFYLTYQSNTDGTRTGAVLNATEVTFSGNSAMAGGAISVRSDCQATLNKAQLLNNSVAGYDNKNEGDGEGGGAVYVGYGKLILRDVTATGNTASDFGGVVDAAGAEVSVFNGTYTQNKASNGGMLHTVSGSTVTITEAVLKENESPYENTEYNSSIGGGAIHTVTGTLNVSKSTFDSNKTGWYGGAIHAKNTTVNITDNTVFTNNTGATGAALHFSGGSVVTMENSSVTNNKSKLNGTIYIGGATLTMDKVEASDNTGNSGMLYAGSGTTVTLKNSTWTKNSASNGGAIYMKDGAKVYLTDSQLTENTAKNGGAIVNVKATLKINGVTFDSNKATSSHGGAIDLQGATLTTVGENTFSKNTAAKNGGAIQISYFEESDGAKAKTHSVATVNNVTFTENEAATGGAFNVVAESSVSAQKAAFTGNKATGNGGAVHVSEGAIAELTELTFTENSAGSNGGAIYLYNTDATTSKLKLEKNSAGSHGGAIYVAAQELNVDSDWTFTGNSAAKHGGAIYLTYMTVDGNKIGATLNATNAVFDGNSAMAGGAVSARTNCAVNMTGGQLINNSVTGYDGKNDGDGDGGGAIYVGYGEVTLTNVTATCNTASDFGGVVEAVSSPVTVSSGTFSGNSSNSGGVIHAMTGSTVTFDGSTLTANESVYVQASDSYDSTIGGGAIHTNGGKLNITATTLDGNKSGYYGGAIHTSKTTVKIDGDSKITNSSGATGAACYFTGSSVVTMENISVTNNTSSLNGVLYVYGTATLDNVVATGNDAVSGGVLFASGSGTNVTVQNISWSKNSANQGGAIYLKEGATVNLNNVTLEENTANQGGAAYAFDAAKLNLNGTTFKKNSATAEGGAIYTRGATITGADATDATNTFVENTAANHAGAIYVNYIKGEEGAANTPGVLTMTGGLFQDNTSTAGGAISARTSCETSLTGTVFKSNSATGEKNTDGGGGAIYTNNNTLSLSGVTFDGNSTGFYGGAVSALGVKLTVKDNTQIINNIGKTGPGIHIRDGGTNVLTNVTLKDNIGTDANGGAVYITGSGTLDISNATISGNKNTNGGVLYASGSGAINITDSTLTGNMASGNGGAIDYRGSGKLTITGTTISGNTGAYGGAVYTSGTGNIASVSSQLTGNTATGKGGAIYATSSGNVTVSDSSSLNTNTAPTAGAVYVDKGATVTINDSTLDGNSATAGDGGAIVVADTSEEVDAATTLNMSGTTLKNNTASAKGGALTTDAGSPNLVINATGCTFSGNKATGAGAGAVEIQNGNCNSETNPTSVTIVFTNCTFTGNSATTTGGAVEIRTSSCAKFDGLTATGNDAKQNGGVIYVTSNYSRLYLAGDISQSGNITGQQGPFVYLYNNKYSNPPKIYTTHASDAAWYASVGGNRTSIEFGLATLP